MESKWQALILVVFILTSFTVTQLHSKELSDSARPQQSAVTTATTSQNSNLATFQYAVVTYDPIKRVPTRRWNVLDPVVSAEAVLIHSLDDDLPLYYSNIHEPWILASLTKLLTAVATMEAGGLNKKVPISREAVATEGIAGNLQSGEVYTGRDLLRIMLLTSSNDAAAALEEFYGGKEIFAEYLNRLATKVGMMGTTVTDGSGLSDENRGTASDLKKLMIYIIKKHPEIFTWTRISELMVQPINNPRTQRVYNINTLVSKRGFLGGKTGTSEIARENLVGIFSVGERRVVLIILGSHNREQDAEILLDWATKAYAL